MGIVKDEYTSHMLSESKRHVKCITCKKTYLQVTTPQQVGFREMDYDVCPYCGNINSSSMEEEYVNYKL